jgi:hypothetical protein
VLLLVFNLALATNQEFADLDRLDQQHRARRETHQRGAQGLRHQVGQRKDRDFLGMPMRLTPVTIEKRPNSISLRRNPNLCQSDSCAGHNGRLPTLHLTR